MKQRDRLSVESAEARKRAKDSILGEMSADIFVEIS